MTKVNKSALSSGRKQVYENTPTYDPSSLSYPLKNVLSLSYVAETTKREDHPLVWMRIKGRLEVYDSRDNVPFEYPFSIEEETEILDEEDGETVGYIVPGNSFDLDELALEIVKSSLPIRLVRKEKVTLTSECHGVKIMSEEEKLKEEKENKITIKGLDE